MKTYSINQLKKLAKEQGYKLAALENQTGKRLQSFNKLTTKVDTQLNTIATRLQSEIYEDGIYTILLSRTNTYNKSRRSFNLEQRTINAATN